MGRTVTLVLIDGEGTLIGSLAPFVVPAPRWQEVADVIAIARERTGFQVSVLRLLTSERDHPPAGAVTYLAEVQSLALSHVHSLSMLPVPKFLAELALRPEALRASWAKPGGPGFSVAWARAQLLALGRGAFVKAEQRRAWNLSAIWCLESRTLSGHPTSTWLKQVPPFLAHEAAVLRWLGERALGAAPLLLASDGCGRALLEHVEGKDADGSCGSERDLFASALHRIQTLALAHGDELVALGLPDRRGQCLIASVREALARVGAKASIVSGLLDDLTERLAAVESCGIGDTLVHGDWRPINVRVQGSRTILIDWTDSFVGHPAFDLLRLTDGCDAEQSRFLIQAWSHRWRTHLPTSEPERAIALLRPVAALCHAARSADICAQIEPTERPFYASDIPRCLEHAAELWRESPRG